jgi:DNA-binding NarL/FixJ family response regulator
VTRLLCVEDDPLVRTFLATRLGMESGFEVAAVVSGAGEALRFLAEQQVDVVLLDYRLEGPDGMQLLGALRERGGAGPRVLFCTGAADEEFQREAREAGAAGVVAKEHLAGELVPALRRVAAGDEWFPPRNEYGAAAVLP